MAYRWFCRLDLADRVPNHSSFSKNRHGRFRDSDVLPHLFETTVARCIAEGFVSGQRFAADASLFRCSAGHCAAIAREGRLTPTSRTQPPRKTGILKAINPAAAPRAVREYIENLDDAAFGAATTVEPKFTSHSDPSSQWTAACKGPAFFAYSTNYLIDTDHAVIVDVEATRCLSKELSADFMQRL